MAKTYKYALIVEEYDDSCNQTREYTQETNAASSIIPFESISLKSQDGSKIIQIQANNAGDGLVFTDITPA